MRAEAGLLLALLVAACDGSAAGVDAYREGRFREAHAAFVDAETRAGRSASEELLWNRALAGLRAGELSDAQAALDRAGARGGSELTELRDFLQGNVAFARCELAQAQARTPEAEPFAYDYAIALAQRARYAWQSAAASRADWPEARRNVERALSKLAELEEEKGRADPKKKKEPQGRPREKPGPRPDTAPDQPDAPPPPPKPTGDGTDAPPDATGEENELSPAAVRRLLEVLAVKEKEKVAMRRARRQAISSEVDRDW